MTTQVEGIVPTRWFLGKLRFSGLYSALFSRIPVRRSVLLSVFSFAFALVATFRTFGFDLDTAKEFYPYVADGWGIWYWVAQTGLRPNSFFFIVNFAFSILIFQLAFPAKQHSFPLVVSMATILYLDLWFLFGQARYGMAVTLIAIAVAYGGLPSLILIGTLSYLIHKATIGGLLLVALWLVLQRTRYGLSIAALLCSALIFVIKVTFSRILLLIGYGNYLVWSSLPDTNTPVKFYFIIAVLLLWKYLDKNAPNKILILTLLFLPFAYVNVFAGRAYELYAILLLPCLGESSVKEYVRYPILALFIADVSLLLFNSGFYF